jgi:hypothetical protein
MNRAPPFGIGLYAQAPGAAPQEIEGAVSAHTGNDTWRERGRRDPAELAGTLKAHRKHPVYGVLQALGQTGLLSPSRLPRFMANRSPTPLRFDGTTRRTTWTG